MQLGFDCDCRCADCDVCRDGDVVLLLTLSGIVTGAVVHVPPGLGDCPACEDLDLTTIPLSFVGKSAVPGVADAAGLGCEYGGSLDCLSLGETPEACPPRFSRSLEARAWLYRTVGGDVRSHVVLLMTETTFVPDGGLCVDGPGSGSRIASLSDDQSLAVDAAEIDCLAIDLAGTWTEDSIIGPSGGYCNSPTGYTLQAEAA